jgi:hypothetical protein
VRVDPNHPLSTRLVEFLRSRAPDVKPITPQTDADDPYYQAGAHPDIVEQVWDKIGAKLPVACRCLLYGVPVLVQPDSGIVLAMAMGTGYGCSFPKKTSHPHAPAVIKLLGTSSRRRSMPRRSSVQPGCLDDSRVVKHAGVSNSTND